MVLYCALGGEITLRALDRIAGNDGFGAAHAARVGERQPGIVDGDGEPPLRVAPPL
jgi:hypothetical protein